MSDIRKKATVVAEVRHFGRVWTEIQDDMRLSDSAILVYLILTSHQEGWDKLTYEFMGKKMRLNDRKFRKVAQGFKELYEVGWIDLLEPAKNGKPCRWRVNEKPALADGEKRKIGWKDLFKHNILGVDEKHPPKKWGGQTEAPPQKMGTLAPQKMGGYKAVPDSHTENQESGAEAPTRLASPIRPKGGAEDIPWNAPAKSWKPPNAAQSEWCTAWSAKKRGTVYPWTGHDAKQWPQFVQAVPDAALRGAVVHVYLESYTDWVVEQNHPFRGILARLPKLVKDAKEHLRKQERRMAAAPAVETTKYSDPPANLAELVPRLA